MELLLSVFENATSPEGIRNTLLETRDFKGAAGDINFNPQGENVSVPIYKLENGGMKRMR